LKTSIVNSIFKRTAVLLAIQLLLLSFGLKASVLTQEKNLWVEIQSAFNLENFEASDLFDSNTASKGESETNEDSQPNLEEEVEFSPDFKVERGILAKSLYPNKLHNFSTKEDCYFPFHPEKQSPPPKS
jgi:hypothetical protein